MKQNGQNDNNGPGQAAPSSGTVETGQGHDLLPPRFVKISACEIYCSWHDTLNKINDDSMHESFAPTIASLHLQHWENTLDHCFFSP
jgi:hypothetical protein